MCYYFAVKVDGGWSGWGGWGSCSKTCDKGTRQRNRLCINPTPKNGGKTCMGSSKNYLSCNPDPCPGNTLQLIVFLQC